MPRRVRDSAAAALALAALFVALAGIDNRVPGHVSRLAGEAVSGRWTEPGYAFGDLLAWFLASPGSGNFFLAALLAAAGLLVLLMVKT